MGFTKLDEGILQSSIQELDSDTFKVWINLLASCWADGIAYVSPVFLASVSHLPKESVYRAIDILSKEDPDSRSINEDGRRIRRVDGGFEVVNYLAYRTKSLRGAEAERKRIYRSTERKARSGYVYFVRSNDRIKVGFSQNPYSRMKELKVAIPDIEMVGKMVGTDEDEKKIQSKYEHLRIGGEWFSSSPELLKDIEQLCSATNTTILDYGNRSPDISASASSSVSSSSLKKDINDSKGRISFDFNSSTWAGIDGADMEGWASAYPACEINIELRRMGEWLKANPDKRKSNYRRFIVNWLTRAQDQGGTQGGTQGFKKSGTPNISGYKVSQIGATHGDMEEKIRQAHEKNRKNFPELDDEKGENE